MLLPDNFADLLSQSLFSAEHSHLDSLKSPLLSSQNFPKIATEMHKIHVCFSMCLVLKQKIRQKNAHSFMIGKEKPQGQDGAWKLYQVQKIANLNPLFLSLKQQAAASRYYNDKHQINSTHPLLIPDYSQYSELIQSQGLQSAIFQLQTLNYLQLLLSSLKNHYENEVNIRSNHWDQGILKLRDEVIAKLIIQSISNSQGSTTFQFFLKYVQSFLPYDPKIIAQRMINIIHESIYYLLNEIEGYPQMKIFQRHGANILSFMLDLTHKILPICKHRVDYVAKLIESIYNLLKLAFLDEQDACVNNKEESDNDFFSINSGETVPSWFREHCPKMLDVLQQSIQIALQSLEHKESIVIKGLALLRFASKNQLIGEFCTTSFKTKDTTYEKQKNLFYIYDILSQIIEFSAGKLTTYWLESHSENNFYLQYQIAHTLFKILIPHSGYTISQKRLITIVCLQYFPLLLEKIPIQTENGITNPIPTMCVFMQKMSSCFSGDQQLMTHLEENVSLLLSKCLTEPYQQSFTTYREEVEACSDYFGPIIRLLLAIKSKKKSEGTHVSIISKQIENIFSNGLRTSNYLLRLSIQQIRCMKSAVYQPYRGEICQLSLFLLENMRFSSYKTEYLMLLEAVMDLLVEDDSAGFDSQFWYFLRNKLPISLPVFIKNIANELINLLLSQRSEYFVQSVVDILYRTYKKLKKIDIELILGQIPQDPTEKLLIPEKDKLNELLKIYFQPVYTLIQDIQSSVLHNLKHYNSRKSVFELIAIIEIQSLKDVYTIYYKFLYSRHNLRTEQGIFYYFIDAFGILVADIDCKYKTALMELIIVQIEQNSHMLAVFSLEYLRDNELALEIFCKFVDNFLHCWPIITHEIYYFARNIRGQLSEKIRLLPKLYGVENAQQLTTIYQAYQRLDKFQISLPQFPQKIYQLQNAYSIDMFRCYLLQSFRNNKADQVMTMFRNIYQRKSMSWTFEEKEAKVNQQILSTVEKIEVLLYFSDYLERAKISLFFDYQRLIASLALTQFQQFVERYSLGSIDIGSFDDTDNEQDPVNYVEQFFKTISQMKLIRKLLQAEYNFSLIAHANEIDFCQFESRFLGKIRCLLYGEKTSKK